MFTKDLVGKIVYLIGTGNNANRTEPNRVMEQVVESVGRVYIQFKGLYGKYRTDTNTDNYVNMTDYNGGYYVFLTIEEVEAHKYKQELKQRLSKPLGYSNYIHKVPVEGLVEIEAVLIKWGLLNV